MDEYEANLLGLCQSCVYDRIECRNKGICQASVNANAKVISFDNAVNYGDCYDCEFDPAECQYLGICKLGGDL